MGKYQLVNRKTEKDSELYWKKNKVYVCQGDAAWH